MTKRTIYCESPAYINLKDKQLQITLKDESKEVIQISIEDIGFLIIDNSQITITSATILEHQHNKVALIICDNKHMPTGLMLPIDGNSIQHERIQLQVKMSQTLKNSLWKQIIIQKIKNQYTVLDNLSINSNKLRMFSKNICSGDKTNREAHASIYYWKNIFKENIDNFKRDKDGSSPNNFLNYGYTILRSTMAKSIVSSGLSPTIGIFHRNKYNAFCLADDLMEPFRPFVDKIVCDIIENNGINEVLTKEHKEYLLNITSLKVISKKETTSLTLAIQNIVNSYVGVLKKNKQNWIFQNFNFMWLIVMYDFPTLSKKEKSDAKKFRKNLLKDGFKMFQYSVYTRYCFDYENTNMHKRRIKKFLTKNAKVSIIQLADKQFDGIEMFNGKNTYSIPKLVMFI